MMKKENCIFCKIVMGQAPAKILYQDEVVTAFRDLYPVAPTHILVVPNEHFDSLDTLDESQDNPLLAHMTRVARRLAAQDGVQGSGYRLVINTGPDAGQSVFHLHLHVLGGRRMPFRFD